MQQIYIDNEQLDIDFILQRQWGRYAELLLGTCGITDRYGVRQYYLLAQTILNTIIHRLLSYFLHHLVAKYYDTGTSSSIRLFDLRLMFTPLMSLLVYY